MHQITICFNPKSTAKNVKKAIALTEKLNLSKITGNEKVISITEDNTLITKDFLAVLDIVNRLAKTEILIDGELIDDASNVYSLITCIKKSYCNGICSLETGVFHKLFREIGITKVNNNYWFFTEYDVEKLNIYAPEIFNLIKPDYIEINSEKLINAFIDSSKNTSKLCSVYSVDATVLELQKLPKILKIKINSFYDSSEDDLDDESQNEILSQNEINDFENDNGIIVKISPKQINELAIKVADEMEIRLRKLMSDLKKIPIL